MLTAFLAPAFLNATQHSGSVRAADQFIPGATVTASQGGVKLVTHTDEEGRYTIDLAPGDWEIQVDMLGFTPARWKMTIAGEPIYKDWAIEMPRPGDPPVVAEAESAPSKPAPEAKPAAPPKPAAETARSRRPQNPGFQSATAKATEEGQKELAEAPAADAAPPNAGGDADEAFLVNGSTSGGLGASSDEEARRQRMSSHDHSGGPGEMGAMAAGLGLPPGMAGAGGDSLGLGGLGASAISGGFGGGPGGDPLSGGMGRGPGGGPDRGPGGRGSGSYGGSSGSSRGRSSGRPSRGGRSSSSGGFASFGNRRTQSPYMGSLYVSLNNSALNAAPFSLNGKQTTKPSYAQSRFGFNFGGPLKIPKILDWPRASFSINYSGSVSRNPYSQLSSLPTAAERGGDFTEARASTPITIFDPLNNLPFAGNIIPDARISPIAKGLLKYFPLPTYSGTVQNYQLIRSTPSNSNSWGARVNLPLSRKDRLSFNVQTQGRDSNMQQLFGFRDTSTGSGLSASAGWSHSFAPRFNNNANYSFSRNNNKSMPFFAYKDNIAALLGITGTSQDPINYGPPTISFTNFGSLSDSSASVSRNQTSSFTDNITYVLKRRHNLTFGFSYRRMQQNTMTYQNARGAFSFSGLATSAIDAQGHPQSRTGFDFADFLLGLPQSSSLRYGSDNNYFRGSATSTYAQDDWRLSRRLSLNFGLRYEYFSPFTELHGRLANLDLNPAKTAVAIVTPGQAAPFSGDLPDSLIRSDNPNLSPRFGFSLRPFAKRSTVIRGGYSIFYSGSAYGQIAAQMASQPPFATTQSLTNSTATPLTLQYGFPILPKQTITNTWSIDPDYKLAYAQSWVFAVQNSFRHGMMVELEYIGTKGTDLGQVFQPNRAQPGASLTNAQTLLPIPNATGFSYQTSHANSSFNCGQVRVTRRFSRGIAGSALYMYSKSLDNASSFSGPGGTTVQYIDDLHLERGLSTFDQRHRLQSGFMASSPVGVHGLWRNGGWKTKTLAGWMISGSFSATSGSPLTARVAGNLSNTGGTAAFGTGRAQATGLGIHDGNYPFFNLLAFTTPPAGQYGNAGRSTIPGPLVTSFNSSLNRAFRFGDTRRTLQLRLSASNALNHVVITSFGTTVNSANYGLATAASATRTVNLLLRFSF